MCKMNPDKAFLRNLFVVALLCLYCSVVPAQGQKELDSIRIWHPLEQSRAEPILNEQLPSILSLPELVEDDIDRYERMRSASLQPNKPYLIGLLKKMESPISLALPSGASTLRVNGLPPGDQIIQQRYQNHVEIVMNISGPESQPFRLYLEEIEGADGMLVSVAGGQRSGGSVIYKSNEDRHLLLPTVSGPKATITMQIPYRAFKETPFNLQISGMTIELAEQADSECLPGINGWQDCSIDAACVDVSSDPVNPLRAVARLKWLSDGGGYFLCTGTLVAQRNYIFRNLLTANHCLNTQSEADTLEARFDYFSDICGGTPPPFNELPTTTGSDLLRTNATNDMTYLNLNGPAPQGFRSYLGWTTANLDAGQQYRRFSHPAGGKMHFTRSSPAGGFSCSGRPGSSYWYSQNNQGSSTSGSSGSALIDSETRIVGQLFGVCHTTPWDECDSSSFRQLDGRFNVTYPQIEPWLERPGPVPLQLDVPLTGLTSASAPLEMKYYTFSPVGGSDQTYRFLVSGGGSNVELYVKQDGYFPTTTDWTCRAVGSSDIKQCTLSGGFQYRIGLKANGNYSGVALTAIEIGPGMFWDRFQDFPEIPLSVDPFSAASEMNGGNEVIRHLPVTDSISGIRGFEFQGAVSGISGNSSWASDMKMIVRSPDGQEFEVGGFESVVNEWEFQGGLSTSDGTYQSTHQIADDGSPVFGPNGTDSFGIWTLTFSNDWNSSTAATMNWSNVELTLLTRPAQQIP